MDKISIIEKIPLFDILTPTEKERMMEMMEYQLTPRYHYVFNQGDSADTIFLLAKGSIKVGTVNDEGKEIIKHILHPEMVFGEMALVDHSTYRNFAMTLSEEVAYFRISSSNFKRLMQSNSQLSFRVLNMIGKRLQRAEGRLESLIFKDARERIIDFLRDNALQRGRKVGFETLFKHSLTQQDIANFTGTSRQTVTSVLNDLRKSNQIYFNRKSILIRDLANLA